MGSIAPPVVDAAGYESRPFVDGRKVLLNGKVTEWKGAVQEVFAPIYKVRPAPRLRQRPLAPSAAPDAAACAAVAQEAGSEEKVLIGYQARMGEEDSLKALDAAVSSWDNGRGPWALATPEHRIAKVEEFVKELKPLRAQIVKVQIAHRRRPRPAPAAAASGFRLNHRRH